MPLSHLKRALMTVNAILCRRPSSSLENAFLKSPQPAYARTNSTCSLIPPATQQVLTAMPLPHYSCHYPPSHHTNTGQGSSRRYDDELDWLEILSARRHPL